MRKYLLLTGAALIGLSDSAYAAINCAVPPTCDELGYAYTADDCAGQSTLKCPFDQEKVFCGEPAKPSTAVTCTVGAVLYDDLKCYDKAPDGKTAIAVVFDTSKRLAISLSAGVNNVQWGSFRTDISTLTNCTTSNYTTCDTDGKSNAQKIIAVQGESISLAAGFCYTRTYGGLPEGSWFLPSASELKTLYNNRAKVNAGLTSLGSTALPTSGWYWSSTEIDSYSALVLALSNGTVVSNSKSHTTSSFYTRCVVAY